MSDIRNNNINKVTLSVVIPCYNEEKTLAPCVECVMAIAGDDLALEVIIVDDASRDQSLRKAEKLKKKYPQIVVLRHEKNQGKGAALRTGFQKASGDFVAVQDADLEYDPQDLKRLLVPLRKGEADVVLGSRFQSSGYHRVLYFWHYLGNCFLTFLSNMFTDLNLSDMETCYKVFRRDVIQAVKIEENRFGFEPEIVAKVAQMRLRIFEMGISYRGRTYAEGKKIGVKDGFRALYCIFRYNAHKAPVPVQFIIYVFIGGLAALMNLMIFLGLHTWGVETNVSIITAYGLAALVNYFLCVAILFRHRARWNTFNEILIFLFVVGLVGSADLLLTKALLAMGISAVKSKLAASVSGVMLNFMGRRFLVFPEASVGPWQSQENPLPHNEGEK